MKKTIVVILVGIISLYGSNDSLATQEWFKDHNYPVVTVEGQSPIYKDEPILYATGNTPDQITAWFESLDAFTDTIGSVSVGNQSGIGAAGITIDRLDEELLHDPESIGLLGIASTGCYGIGYVVGIKGYAENGIGVFGKTESKEGPGVLGVNTASYGKGVFGRANNNDGAGVAGTADRGTGVRGTGRVGVRGIAKPSVDAETPELVVGVQGLHYTSHGVAVEGKAINEDGYTIAVKGENKSTHGIAVAAICPNDGQSIGVYAQAVGKGYSVWADGAPIRFPVLPVDPQDPENGSIWVNSSDGKLKIRINGVTINLN